ncbi:hypothetical protein RIF29_28991 [Crotalaria pallida]|uniref:Uncharacterized protein n=1 Tax=Crotalaria pallida TaxID=3830 RepID=A0AAN9HTG9_CROPI
MDSGIDKKESDPRNRLDMIQGELMQNPNDTSLQVAEKDILHQYMKVKQAAYSFLQQKAKISMIPSMGILLSLSKNPFQGQAWKQNKKIPK